MSYVEKGYDRKYGEMLMEKGFKENYEVCVCGGNRKRKDNICLG